MHHQEGLETANLTPRSPRRARRAFTSALITATTATLILLSGCAPAAPVDAASESPDAASLSAFYDQELAWGACDDFATTLPQEEVTTSGVGECARLEVPLDYADPTGATASVAVSRVAARGEAIGSLLHNPGGPGGPGLIGGIAMSVLLAESPIGEKFDIVGFDPRAVGATIPAADCYSTDGTTRGDELFPTLAMRPALTEEDTRAVFERCAEGSGGADALAHMGTRDTARDMDVLRAVLGDEKLNFLGQSYGTRLGAVYAEEFPDRVRAMILDGAFDPTLSTIERFVSSYGGFQSSFDAMAAECAQQPDCPLGTDPARATEVFQSIVQPLRQQPVPAGDSELDFDDAINAVIAGLYSEANRPALLEGIAQVRDGRGDILSEFGGDGTIDTETIEGNIYEALIAINCMDEERLTPDDMIALRERTAEVAPFMDAGEGIAVGARDHCEFWPEAPTLGIPYAQNIEGLPPTLVVSQLGDPTTPHSGAISLAETLGSSLLAVDAANHTVVSGGQNPCVDEIASNYLINLELPDEMPQCPA
jgi:pimeloyl-ACP methyl ester carboxylesterase